MNSSSAFTTAFDEHRARDGRAGGEEGGGEGGGGRAEGGSGERARGVGVDGGGGGGANRWFYSSLTDCMQALGSSAYAPPNSDKYSYKRCGSDGQWERRGQQASVSGWTDYTQCYTDEARRIYDKLFAQSSSQVMKEIAVGTKTMEMVGLCSSLVLLSISIFIFCYFRNLKCHRTRIHRNLFAAILIHVCILLVVDIDQLIGRKSGAKVAGVVITNTGNIYNTQVVCELLYALMEYTKTVMFMWMLIEGMYLHNMLVLSVFSGKPNYVIYYSLGWVFPVFLTSAWGITNGILNKEQCWFGYTFRPYYWILEAPRAAVIAINLTFLVNIIRVLVTKLRDNNSTEAVQVRKAVKAAIVLLPLLGVNNFLAMVEPPTDSVVKFGIWSYTSQFLISFQGVYISMLYCFFNGEVQSTLRTQWQRYRQSTSRQPSSDTSKHRLNRSYTTYTTVPDIHHHQGKSYSVDMSSMKSLSVDLTAAAASGRRKSSSSSSCQCKTSLGSGAWRPLPFSRRKSSVSSSQPALRLSRADCTAASCTELVHPPDDQLTAL